MTKIYDVDQSTRSSHSNAYFYGFGKNKRIVLFDTLVKHNTTDEIVAIIGHELGHWYYSHNLKNIIITFVSFTLVNCILKTNLFFVFFLFSFVIKREDIFISFGFS